MIGNPKHSTWGIKDSGEDISLDILDIINNATSFIIVGGYNFTFKTSGYTFFNLLRAKVTDGIPVLMIIPSNLPGSWSNQSTIVNYCISHGIGIILNGNNHSKWLMTENDLYYGSSNFTETSWKQRVEVVTIHKHSNIKGQWKRDTILDFRQFVQREIARLNRRKTMKNIPGLITHTIATWNNIRPLVKKLNPSIEKVIYTLNHYHEVEQMIETLMSEWFDFYNPELFEEIYKLNSEILFKVNELCEFAYFNIYNESTVIEEFDDVEIINKYNFLHVQVINTIEENINHLSENVEQLINSNFQINFKNNEILAIVDSKLSDNNT